MRRELAQRASPFSYPTANPSSAARDLERQSARSSSECCAEEDSGEHRETPAFLRQLRRDRRVATGLDCACASPARTSNRHAEGFTMTDHGRLRAFLRRGIWSHLVVAIALSLFAAATLEVFQLRREKSHQQDVRELVAKHNVTVRQILDRLPTTTCRVCQSYPWDSGTHSIRQYVRTIVGESEWQAFEQSPDHAAALIANPCPQYEDEYDQIVAKLDTGRRPTNAAIRHCFATTVAWHFGCIDTQAGPLRLEEAPRFPNEPSLLKIVRKDVSQGLLLWILATAAAVWAFLTATNLYLRESHLGWRRLTLVLSPNSCSNCRALVRHQGRMGIRPGRRTCVHCVVRNCRAWRTTSP